MGKNSLLSTSSKSVVTFTQPPTQWVLMVYPTGEAAGAWGWPLTFISCRSQEYVDLYTHCHKYLTDMSTGHRNRNTFVGEQRGRCVRPTNLPPSVSRLSRECGILSIAQTYTPPRPVTGIALLFYMWMMFVPNREYTYILPRPVMEIVLLYHM
jgi:hypothetical protein